MAFIYVLKDPRTDEVRYVGQTKYQHMRYKRHSMNVGKRNIARTEWIAELKAIGLLPEYSVLEENVDWDSRFEREKHWIRYYRNQGASLTNL